MAIEHSRRRRQPWRLWSCHIKIVCCLYVLEKHHGLKSRLGSDWRYHFCRNSRSYELGLIERCPLVKTSKIETRHHSNANLPGTTSTNSSANNSVVFLYWSSRLTWGLKKTQHKVRIDLTRTSCERNKLGQSIRRLVVSLAIHHHAAGYSVVAGCVKANLNRINGPSFRRYVRFDFKVLERVGIWSSYYRYKSRLQFNSLIAKLGGTTQKKFDSRIFFSTWEIFLLLICSPIVLPLECFWY